METSFVAQNFLRYSKVIDQIASAVRKDFPSQHKVIKPTHLEFLENLKKLLGRPKDVCFL